MSLPPEIRKPVRLLAGLLLLAAACIAPRERPTADSRLDGGGGSGLGTVGRNNTGGNGGSGDGNGNGGDAGGTGTGGNAGSGGGAGGSSGCESGFHKCNGKCVDDTSPDNCGVACTPCPGVAGGKAVCDGTKCGAECPSGQKPCDDKCIPEGQFCGTCPTGKNPCNGMCVDAKSLTSCGPSCTMCPTAAGGTPTCDGNKCGLQCDGESMLCDGQCIAKSTPCKGVCAADMRLCGDKCVPGADGSCCSDSECGTCKSCQGNRCQNTTGKCSPTTCNSTDIVEGQCMAGACRPVTVTDCGDNGCSSATRCNQCKGTESECTSTAGGYRVCSSGTWQSRTCASGRACSGGECDDDRCADSGSIPCPGKCVKKGRYCFVTTREGSWVGADGCRLDGGDYKMTAGDCGSMIFSKRCSGGDQWWMLNVTINSDGSVSAGQWVGSCHPGGQRWNCPGGQRPCYCKAPDPCPEGPTLN